MSVAETTIMNAIRSLLRRRAADEVYMGPDADIYEDVGLDSLEIAELSAILEDELGSDPYSAGLVPRTVGELLAFYEPA